MQETIDQAWNGTCDVLKETLSADVFERWISVIQPVKLTEKNLTLSVSNDFYCTWLEENYISLISSAFTSHTGLEVKVHLSVQREENSTNEPETKTAEVRITEQTVSNNNVAPTREDKPLPIVATPKGKTRPRAKDFQLNPNFTFESFIVGSSNEFAHAACSAVAHAPAKAYNPLFMYGGVGLGKTHLMQAIGNHAIKNGKYKVAYLSSEAFTNEYIDALMRKDLIRSARSIGTSTCFSSTISSSSEVRNNFKKSSFTPLTPCLTDISRSFSLAIVPPIKSPDSKNA